MNFPNTYFLFIVILGALLLYSYYHFLKKTTADKLWGRIKGKFRLFYYLSMLISAVGFLLLLYYLYKNNNLTMGQIDTLYLWILLFIIISMFWMPFSIEYIVKKSIYVQYSVYFVLFLVALSALMILHTLLNIKDKQFIQERLLAIIGVSYLFFHTFVMDLILWTQSFF